MSDLRVALIAEGPTDAVVIEAALRTLLPGPFILTLLQPEPTRPGMGNGWGGVLRWCVEFARRGHSRLEDDPTLPGFDMFVIHTDADVAEYAYAEVSEEIASLAADSGWPTLPNRVPCPHPYNSADVVRDCLLAWAGIATLGPRTVLCVPSKASDAWLVAAAFDADHPLLVGLECNLNVATQLGGLPKAQRVKKSKREYLDRQSVIAAQWPAVRQLCSQAERFSADVEALVL